MKRIFLTVALLLMVGAIAFAQDNLIGFEYSLEFGTIHNNLFQLYENDELEVDANLGNNGYIDALLRFYVWRFFISGHGQMNMYWSYLPPQKMTVGGSLGWIPVNWLILEIGYEYKDTEMLAIPYNYHVANHNTYFRISGKAGNVR